MSSLSLIYKLFVFINLLYKLFVFINIKGLNNRNLDITLL